MYKILACTLTVMLALACQNKPEGVYFHEDFNDEDLPSRGWYSETHL